MRKIVFFLFKKIEGCLRNYLSVFILAIYKYAHMWKIENAYFIVKAGSRFEALYTLV